ncbi:hypothetical protein E2C01_035729 [Portunus trituberculatus]|uniref:Uncharacterized protein n=1 Tax=Portunus trituberculatus TaxID=210409 RepID=A0A5B7F951_PORTR|nr:hypothetical protein [Portunus trituberculatus]
MQNSDVAEGVWFEWESVVGISKSGSCGAPEADGARAVPPLQASQSRGSQGGSLRTRSRINTGALNRAVGKSSSTLTCVVVPETFFLCNDNSSSALNVVQSHQSSINQSVSSKSSDSWCAVLITTVQPLYTQDNIRAQEE